MTYAASQAKVFGKRPVWLYEVTLDGTANYLTSKKGGYTYNSQAYTEAAIGHSNIKQTATIAKSQVTLTLPRSNTIAQSVRDSADLTSTSIVLRHGYTDDGDLEFLSKFEGRIVSVKPLLGTISLICESDFTAFRRKAIGKVMQRPCPYALYFGKCPAVLASHQTSATATAWADPILTVTEASSQSDGFYAGGLVQYGTKMSMITKHEGTSLTLLSPLTGLGDEITSSGSASISIARGCNRTMAHCSEITGSAAPHGGFPWMTETPFDGRLIY